MFVTSHTNSTESRSAGQKRILTWNSHSRSFKSIHFAINYRLKRVAYHHTIRPNLFKFPKKERSKSPKIAVDDNHIITWCPHPEEPLRISACILHFQKLESLAYISAADNIHSNFCSGLQKTHLFGNRECISAVQGHPRSKISVPIKSAYVTSY